MMYKHLRSIRSFISVAIGVANDLTTQNETPERKEMLKEFSEKLHVCDSAMLKLDDVFPAVPEVASKACEISHIVDTSWYYSASIVVAFKHGQSFVVKNREGCVDIYPYVDPPDRVIACLSPKELPIRVSIHE